ncbi:MAG TPA: beta-aspartyl-peptidase [Desulfobacteria bacterium]|nr:beta-aspartyl-peptidase [Desulfobacteria bacterium]
MVKNGIVYAPEHLGRQDILIGAGQIFMINPEINLKSSIFSYNEIDAGDCFVLPGFIDQHVHIAGAGGEGGPSTRTPEIGLSELTTGGITTVVGLLGFDGVTRSMGDLLAKARGLEEEGITSYIYSGTYELPTRTITGAVKSDLVLIDKVLGIGEIAISDHRSAQPTLEQMIKIAAEARIGGMIGNKPGIVHVHVGEGKNGMSLISDSISRSDIPISQFVPTHVNRLSGLFDEAMSFARNGGAIDLTSGFYPENDSPKSLEVYMGLEKLLENGISLDKVTVSSDANGSLPVFNESGELKKLVKGSVKPLWNDLSKAIFKEIVSISAGVALITRNPAKILKLYPQKGVVSVGSDADLVLIHRDSFKIEKVLAKGRLMVDKGQPLIWGTFEKQ